MVRRWALQMRRAMYVKSASVATLLKAGVKGSASIGWWRPDDLGGCCMLQDRQAVPGECLVASSGGLTVPRSAYDGEFEIGRGEHCHIRLLDRVVSGCHLIVLPRRSATGGFEWSVTDRSSKGTWRNADLVRLEPGQPYWFGLNLQLRLGHQSFGPVVRLNEMLDSTGDYDTGVLPRGFRIKLNERDVLAGLRAGMTARQIGTSVHLAERTIETTIARFKASLAKALGIDKVSTAQLVELAVQLEIPPLGPGQ